MFAIARATKKHKPYVFERGEAKRQRERDRQTDRHTNRQIDRRRQRNKELRSRKVDDRKQTDIPDLALYYPTLPSLLYLTLPYLALF